MPTQQRAHADREASATPGYAQRDFHGSWRNKMNKRIRRVQAGGCKRRAAMRPAKRGSHRISGVRERLSGQAAIIIALAMLFIILMVGLAIDGGASYGLRRQAQNASDGSALA